MRSSKGAGHFSIVIPMFCLDQLANVRMIVGVILNGYCEDFGIFCDQLAHHKRF
jgi:hypothetical protein